MSANQSYGGSQGASTPTDVEPSLSPSDHTRFKKITKRMSKCDRCNERNTSVMQQCLFCAQTICRECHAGKSYDVKHIMSDYPDLDWTLPAVIKPRPAKRVCRRAPPKYTFDSADDDDDDDADDEDDDVVITTRKRKIPQKAPAPAKNSGGDGRILGAVASVTGTNRRTPLPTAPRQKDEVTLGSGHQSLRRGDVNFFDGHGTAVAPTSDRLARRAAPAGMPANNLSGGPGFGGYDRRNPPPNSLEPYQAVPKNNATAVPQRLAETVDPGQKGRPQLDWAWLHNPEIVAVRERDGYVDALEMLEASLTMDALRQGVPVPVSGIAWLKATKASYGSYEGRSVAGNSRGGRLGIGRKR
ncbi:hypothetical protein BJ170DRAFT_685026 [Xylariales sp. AK1849]|nr:hypothetical protein BJ170DRAFT_685026 [Xylariales sp. AK1849]